MKLTGCKLLLILFWNMMIFKNQVIQRLPPDVESKPYRSSGCIHGDIVSREMGVDPKNGCYDITGDS